eukprot:SAG31_NODE_4603_length_3099_cov_2.042971_4_plen_177_part_00
MQNSDGGIILFMDELHLALGAGKAGGGAMDAANLLKPMLARGEMRCIGATTVVEYRTHIEKDKAFERRFQPCIVEEPSPDNAVLMLQGLKQKYEGHHNGARPLTSRRRWEICEVLSHNLLPISSTQLPSLMVRSVRLHIYLNGTLPTVTYQTKLSMLSTRLVHAYVSTMASQRMAV